MLFMKVFATNINKPYTITETQMRVLGMFFSVSENVCNQATNKPVPAFVLYRYAYKVYNRFPFAPFFITVIQSVYRAKNIV